MAVCAHHNNTHSGRPVEQVGGRGQHDIKGLPAVPGEEPALNIAVPRHAGVPSPDPQLLHLTLSPSQARLTE